MKVPNYNCPTSSIRWHFITAKHLATYQLICTEIDGSYLHDHRSKVVKLGSGWFCRQKFSHYLPLKSKTVDLLEGLRTNHLLQLNLWFVGLGLVRWVHLKWSRLITVVNYNGVYFFVNWAELGSPI